MCQAQISQTTPDGDQQLHDGDPAKKHELSIIVLVAEPYMPV